jgi:hypothetical protein
MKFASNLLQVVELMLLNSFAANKNKMDKSLKPLLSPRIFTQMNIKSNTSHETPPLKSGKIRVFRVS